MSVDPMATRPSWLSFVSMQALRWCHVLSCSSSEPPPRFWHPKTVHRWFYGPNHETHSRVAYSIRVPHISTHVTAVLNCPDAKSSSASARLARPSSWLGHHGNSSMYTCTYRCPQVSAIAAGHPASLVPRSKPSITYRHRLAWPSPSPVTTASELHTCAP